MKKRFFILLITIILITNLTLIISQDLPNYYDKNVNDFGGLFNNNQTFYLKSLLSSVEEQTSAEVVVVVINTTSPDTPEQYRYKLFNYWHIGKKDKNNGLLILYSIAEHRIEVETGYGMEGILPDSRLGRLLDTYYIPNRDSGNVTNGIISFTQEVSKIIIENKAEVISGNSENGSKSDFNDSIFLIIFFILFIGFFILIFFLINKTEKGFKLNFEKNKNLLKQKKSQRINFEVSDDEVKNILDVKKTKAHKIIGLLIMLVFLSFFVLPILLGFTSINEFKMFLIFPVLFVILFILIMIASKIPYICPKCNEKMSYEKNIGRYKIYKCKNSHEGKLYIPPSTSHSSGGFSSGGSSFSSGGSSFGGGSSGGGGAGR